MKTGTAQMDTRHRAVIIGVGDRGSVYSKACIDAGVEIACIYDIDPHRYEIFHERFSEYASPAEASSLEEALSTPGADVAFICVPAFFHADYAMEALRHGLNVLCEKPFDLDMEKVEALGKLAEETGLKLAVGHQYHNFRNLHSLRTIFEKGLLGRPAVLRFTDLRERRPKLAMHDMEHGNGGPMMDMCCHFVDMMRWCFDSEPVRVTSRRFEYAEGDAAYADFEHQAPDTALEIVEFASGDMGMITVCWGMERSQRGPADNGFGEASSSPVDGFGPEGFIKPFELWSRDSEVTVSLPEGKRTIDFTEDEMEDFIFPEKTTLLHLLRAIEGSGEVQVAFSEGRTALAATLAGIRASVTMRPECVEDILRESPTALRCMIDRTQQ